MVKKNSNQFESSRVFYYESDASNIIADFITDVFDANCLILCIGTDRYIGDCLGPVVGTLLKKEDFKFPILGTLENPVHAVNLKKFITYINEEYPNHTIIAIDACLGDNDNVGSIQVKKGCIHPGKGVGKTLPSIGDYGIIGIVDSSDKDDFLFMHNIRLNTIMQMAETIAAAIIMAAKQK